MPIRISSADGRLWVLADLGQPLRLFDTRSKKIWQSPSGVAASAVTLLQDTQRIAWVNEATGASGTMSLRDFTVPVATRLISPSQSTEQLFSPEAEASERR